MAKVNNKQFIFFWRNNNITGGTISLRKAYITYIDNKSATNVLRIVNKFFRQNKNDEC